MVLKRLISIVVFFFCGVACAQTFGPVSTQQFNYVYLVAGPTPTNLLTVGGTNSASALFTACAANSGNGMVVIQQGANPSDAPTLGGVASYTITGGCAGVTILDERGTAGWSFYAYTNSTTYTQIPLGSSGSGFNLPAALAASPYSLNHTTCPNGVLTNSATTDGVFGCVSTVQPSGNGYIQGQNTTGGSLYWTISADSSGGDIILSGTSSNNNITLFGGSGKGTFVNTAGSDSARINFDSTHAFGTFSGVLKAGPFADGTSAHDAVMFDQITGFFANPMTTLGDMIYGGASGVPTRVAGLAPTATTPYILNASGTGSAAGAPGWATFQTILNMASLVVGTINISGTCTSGYQLYNNSGKLGCEAPIASAGIEGNIQDSDGDGGFEDSGIASANVVTLTGTQTLTNKTLTSPVISGGTINNATIGATTPAAGTFTSTKSPYFQSIGTKFTASGSCNAGTLIGGSTAGSFVSGTSGGCSETLTLGGATATNGWACSATDTNNPTATFPLFAENAFTTTTVTFSTATVALASGDVIVFSCTAY